MPHETMRNPRRAQVPDRTHVSEMPTATERKRQSCSVRWSMKSDFDVRCGSMVGCPQTERDGKGPYFAIFLHFFWNRHVTFLQNLSFLSLFCQNHVTNSGQQVDFCVAFGQGSTTLLKIEENLERYEGRGGSDRWEKSRFRRSALRKRRRRNETSKDK